MIFVLEFPFSWNLTLRGVVDLEVPVTTVLDTPVPAVSTSVRMLKIGQLAAVGIIARDGV